MGGPSFRSGLSPRSRRPLAPARVVAPARGRSAIPRGRAAARALPRRAAQCRAAEQDPRHDRREHPSALDGARQRARYPRVDLHPRAEAEEPAPRGGAGPLVPRLPQAEHHHRHQRAGGSGRLQARAAQPRAPAEARLARRGSHLLPPPPRPAGARLSALGSGPRRPQVSGTHDSGSAAAWGCATAWGCTPAWGCAETAGGRPRATRMSRLTAKVAIVTGTSPNIGGGIAQGLADEGATVVCVDVGEDNARQCAEWITKRGGTALGIPCDVTDEQQVEAMVARVRETYGGVDILVNNAGILGGMSVLDMPLDRWSRQVAVNLTGTFLCTKHVARSWW